MKYKKSHDTHSGVSMPVLQASHRKEVGVIEHSIKYERREENGLNISLFRKVV